MGDYAIVKAEKEFIRNALTKDAQIIEIPVRCTESAIDIIEKTITEDDIIILSGGGYVGDEYIEVYVPLLSILKKFRKNLIIMFPQTVFFHSEKRQERFMRQCKKCLDLNIFVREHVSQQIFNRYGIGASIVPDIVLSCTPIIHVERKGVLMCMRNDVEKAVSTEDHDLIVSLLRKYGEVELTDTVASYIFEQSERFVILEEMWEKFSKSALVVTDRIHGMIFAYLTNTPCVAIGNYNHKVESEYQWLSHCNNIRFVANLTECDLKQAIEMVMQAPLSKNCAFEDEFCELKRILSEKI